MTNQLKPFSEKILSAILLNILLISYTVLRYGYSKYCVEMWESSLKSHLDPLVKIQKKCIGTISFLKYLAPSEPLLQKLNNLNFEKLVIQRIRLMKTTFSKKRVAYNNVYRKILGVSRRVSASGMFVSNDIPNFEAFLRKSIYLFTTRLSSSSNKMIEQSWIMKSLVWKTWEEKCTCTFKSTLMSFSVFLVFMLPDFICTFFYFI